jgi:F-type H+-transporting ATPase subunit epsilon
MKLKILLPSQVLLEKEVDKVIAEAVNGLFCLLPAHVDFVASLVPGILTFESKESGEEFVGIDEGILVKDGDEVVVSTRHGITGANLGDLRLTIEKRFRVLDERERAARTALAKLEANFIRSVLEIEHG